MWQLKTAYLIPPVLSTEGVIRNKLNDSLKLPNLLHSLYILIQKAVILNVCRIVWKVFAWFQASAAKKLRTARFWVVAITRHVITQKSQVLWKFFFLAKQWIRSAWSVRPVMFWKPAKPLWGKGSGWWWWWWYSDSGTHFIYRFFFTYPFPTLRSLSPHTAVTNPHTPFSLLLFLPVSCWLLALLFLQMFSSAVGKSKFSYMGLEFSYFLWLGNTRDFCCPEQKFWGTPEQSSLNPLKPGLFLKNRDKSGP